MRKALIAANWKMNKTVREATEFLEGLVMCLPSQEDREVLICPPFTALALAGRILAQSHILLGAQNLYPEEAGAYTGEISPSMLLDAGCSYVILGHSERREYFAESDEFINRKVRCALHYGLKPILCVGETLAQREAGRAQEVVSVQLRADLAGVAAGEMPQVVIAYEPIWAIGTGRTATPWEAQEMHGYMRGVLEGLYRSEVAQAVRIQYGGSVRPDNIDELMACPDIDGALVGGASLQVDSFLRIALFQV